MGHNQSDWEAPASLGLKAALKTPPQSPWAVSEGKQPPRQRRVVSITIGAECHARVIRSTRNAALLAVDQLAGRPTLFAWIHADAQLQP